MGIGNVVICRPAGGLNTQEVSILVMLRAVRCVMLQMLTMTINVFLYPSLLGYEITKYIQIHISILCHIKCLHIVKIRT